MLYTDVLKKSCDILNCCEFLGCQIEDDISEIRKIFFYKLNYLYANFSVIRDEYEKIYDATYGSSTNYPKDIKMNLDSEIRKNIEIYRLISDAYAAIMLYKIDKEKYDLIIKSYSIQFSEYHKPVLETIIRKNKRIVLFSDLGYYIEELDSYRHSGTNEGLYRYTNSIFLIMELESEVLKHFNEEIELLIHDTDPKYGEDGFSGVLLNKNKNLKHQLT